jgi:hypothetical protein
MTARVPISGGNMTDYAAQQARMAKIVELTIEALALADLCGDHMLGAKLDDSHALAVARLAGMNGSSGPL